MTMIRANGIEMHVERLEPPDGGAGAGRTGRNDGPATLVMIHGMASDSLASWYFTVAKPLADAGLRVLMYDLRGHGHSERPPTGYALDDFVDDLSAMLTELDVAGPVHLLGNSFGGTIAFAYAVHHPDRVASVTAIESSPPTRAWMARVARRLDRAANLLPRPEALAQISAGRGNGWPDGPGPPARCWSRPPWPGTFRPVPCPASAQISAIGVPVLCLYGANSAVVELAPAVVRLLPQTRTVVLPGEKHTVLIDRPEAVRRLVLAWLREECAVEVAEAATTP